jgi:putative PIN family toxin of toxin-antitoxin system
LRIVLDASSVVGAALRLDGVPRRALLLARDRHAIALSVAVFEEIDTVLRRPKFDRVLTDDGRQDILELLAAAAVRFVPGIAVRDCRDSKDNKYLQLALAAGAEAIVSSDADLLDLNPWRGFRIVTPSALLRYDGKSD